MISQRTLLLAVALALVVGFLAGAVAKAAVRGVVVPQRSVPSVAAVPATAPPTVAPPWVEPTPRGAVQSTPATVEPQATGTPVAVKKRAVVPAAARFSVSLTWYCGKICTSGYGPGCYCAAASPDLLALGWRGKLVRVSTGGHSVTVRIIDCDCRAHASLDLYAIAFQQLAPLSRGRIGGKAWLT